VDKNKKIPITKPFMPPAEEYHAYLKGIWEREWLSNNGPLVQELEQKLKQYLDVDHLLFVNSGTIALQFAIRALELSGEILTTPFSYIATTSSIVWEGCKPVFVDIDAGSLNLNAALIEDLITPKTSAILASHIFGNPCDIEAIRQVASKHDLKVIYDAAHCFGTLYNGRSIYRYGDVSAASFHATKVFQTVEGGAVITREPELNQKIDFMRNFGHDGPENYSGVGINGKNSELHAAMGLCNLVYADNVLASRKKQFLYYNELLDGLNARRPTVLPEAKINFSYYPLIFEHETDVLEIERELQIKDIHTRRYFYPSLTKLDYVARQHTPVCNDLASRILCLPLYHELQESDQQRIASIIFNTVHAHQL
jgi:dTDP-4-amino-4,6-dideoxygalactose transaminase